MVKLDSNKRGCKLLRCQFQFQKSTMSTSRFLWGVCWLYSWHDTCHGLVAGASSTWKEAHCDVWFKTLDKGMCGICLGLRWDLAAFTCLEWEHRSRQEQSYDSWNCLKDRKRAHWKSLKYIEILNVHTDDLWHIEIETRRSLDQRCAQRYHITLRGQRQQAMPRRPIFFGWGEKSGTSLQSPYNQDILTYFDIY